MKVVIGLGNPDKQYQNTRHNVGWMFLEYLEKKYKFNISKLELDSLTCKTNIKGLDVIFVKPLTYMNLSGQAVLKIKNWYKIENKDILIIFDDIDIPFGNIRYRQKGSGGTHNGMKNIVQMLSSQDIPRIKIGTGGLRLPNQDLKDFVLQKFSKGEINDLQEYFKEAEQKLIEFLDK